MPEIDFESRLRQEIGQAATELEESIDTPDFGTTWRTALLRSKARAIPRRPWRLWQAVAALVVLAAIFIPLTAPFKNTLPEPGSAHESQLLAVADIATVWNTPSDFLWSSMDIALYNQLPEFGVDFEILEEN